MFPPLNLIFLLHSSYVRLKLIIAKNGPNSHFLGIAHDFLNFHIFVSPDPNGLFLNRYICLSYLLG
jgi:hypothetical protein